MKTMILSFIGLASALGVTLSPATSLSRAYAAESRAVRPNFVLILTDDQGWGYTSEDRFMRINALKHKRGHK